jgi:hypothetical protein
MTIVLTFYTDIAHLEHKVEDLEAQVRKLSIGSATDLRTQDVEPEDQTSSWEPLEQVDSALSMSLARHLMTSLNPRQITSPDALWIYPAWISSMNSQEACLSIEEGQPVSK